MICSEKFWILFNTLKCTKKFRFELVAEAERNLVEPFYHTQEIRCGIGSEARIHRPRGIRMRSRNSFSVNAKDGSNLYSAHRRSSSACCGNLRSKVLGKSIPNCLQNLKLVARQQPINVIYYLFYGRVFPHTCKYTRRDVGRKNVS